MFLRLQNILQLHSLASGEKLSTFPLQVGTVVGYSGKKKDTAIFYKFTSFLSPGIIYRCELNKPTIKPEVRAPGRGSLCPAVRRAWWIWCSF